MNKEDFCWVLQSALLNFEGADEEELIEDLKIPPRLAKMGIKLSNKLGGLK